MIRGSTIASGSPRRSPRGCARRFGVAIAVAAALICGVSVVVKAQQVVSLSSEEAIALALENNETLLIALADERTAEGAIREAYAGALPSISLSGTWQSNFKKPAFYAPEEFGGGGKIEIGSDLELQGGLRLDQVLYAFGRVGNAVEYAKIYRKIAGLGVERARSDVVFATREAYCRVLLMTQLVGIRRQSVEQARRHLANVEAKHAQGAASRFELQRAQVEVRNREPELIQAENNLALSKQDLTRWIGLEPDVTLELTDELAYVAEPLGAEAAVTEGLANRPEVRALEQRVAGQRRLLSIYSAGNLPILGLYGQIGLQGQTNFEKPLSMLSERKRAVSTSLGISFQVPIFDGRRTSGQKQQARAGLQRAEYELGQVRKAIRLEITKAVQDLESLQREYEAQLATVDLAEETFAIAETRFTSGVSTQLELTDAETALDLARTSFVEMLYRYNVAVANLARVLGRTTRAGLPVPTGPVGQEEE
jgi:outer membrane protein